VNERMCEPTSVFYGTMVMDALDIGHISKDDEEILGYYKLVTTMTKINFELVGLKILIYYVIFSY
jgi:hypothetical protein